MHTTFSNTISILKIHCGQKWIGKSDKKNKLNKDSITNTLL